MALSDTVRPETPDRVEEVVRFAAASARPLEVSGTGSKAGYGRPNEAKSRLDLAALSGIVLYEPEELVLTACAATPVAEIEAALAEKRQQLAFEPPDLGPLLDADGRGGNIGGTLGGAIACNLAGPRRIHAGSARDHILGFHAVSGRGERFKSGGRVVKNVTGFDLSKLIAGSFGTLAVMTEVTVRALPAADETRTVLVFGCDDQAAVQAMSAALQSPCEISGAAHLPANVATASRVSEVAAAGTAVTALRIEGPGPSVMVRANALRNLLPSFGDIGELDVDSSLVLWREVRDVACFARAKEKPVWRLSLPPAESAQVTARILAAIPGLAFYDWGGGLVWLALTPTLDAGHEVVRRAVFATGGHATLIHAEDEVRARVPVFQPQPPALAVLTRRVKEGFDPKRVLNRGRMYPDV